MSQSSGQGWPPILAPALAQEIAGDTSAIVGFNVLVTDRDGIVIGSGDTDRIGTFHEASVQVMGTLQPAAHSAGQARALRGVRPGVTLPIIIEGEALGTVGITGAPAQVRRFGLVVKRQTEILLQESMLLRSRMLHERAVDDLFRDIAHFDPDVVAPADLMRRAEELGYDLRTERVAVIIELGSPPSPRLDGPGPRPMLPRVIRETFAAPQDLVAVTVTGRSAVLHRLPAEPSAADRPAALRSLGESLAGDIRNRLGGRVRIGIGGVATSLPELRDSCEDAEAALRIGSGTHPGDAVHAIDDLRVHQLLATVPHRARSRFAGAFVAELRSRPDWPVLRQTIITWSECGFNLVRAAEALNIHRNTLVYRLDKVGAARSGGHAGRMALYLACVADRLES